MRLVLLKVLLLTCHWLFTSTIPSNTLQISVNLKLFILFLPVSTILCLQPVYFYSVCLSILLSASRVAELLWSFYRHDSFSINNKTEGKINNKKKRNQYQVLYRCDSLAPRKSVCIQIGNRYRFIISISVLSIGFFFFENGLIKSWWNYFLFPLIFCSAIHRESHLHTKHASETAHRLLHDGAGSILNHNSVPKNAIPSLCGSTRSSLALTIILPSFMNEKNRTLPTYCSIMQCSTYICMYIFCLTIQQC